MAISFLYPTQRIRDYKYQKTKRTKDTEIYYLHSKARRLACPGCNSRQTSLVQTGKTRNIRGLCIGLHQRFILSRGGPRPSKLLFVTSRVFCGKTLIRMARSAVAARHNIKLHNVELSV